MAQSSIYFAGEDRIFDLPLGPMMDLEQACGSVGIGAIYKRIAAHEYFGRDVFSVIKFGLIGGGMKPAEAERLVAERWPHMDMAPKVEIALEILINLMSGIEPDETQSNSDEAKPLDCGKILHSLLQVGMSPSLVREMRYADFIAIIRAVSGKDVQPPTDDEFDELIADFLANGGVMEA